VRGGNKKGHEELKIEASYSGEIKGGQIVKLRNKTGRGSFAGQNQEGGKIQK